MEHALSDDLDKLARLAQEGDKKAYRSLLLQLEVLALRYVSKRLFVKSDAQDVVQEILLSVHKALHTYLHHKRFLPWFYAIASFRVSDYLRALYARPQSVNPDGLADLVFEEQSNFYGCSQDKARLRRLLHSLPTKQKKIIELLYLEGLSACEVSKQIGVSVGNVRVIAHRATRKLAFLWVKEA